MAKYIDADEIDYKIIYYPRSNFYTGTVDLGQLDGVYALKTDIDAMPPADVQEVKHGKWDEIRDGYGKIEGWIHKGCGRMSMRKDEYCSKCGALMDLED